MINLILLLILFINGTLGVFILLNAPRSLSNKIFSVLCFIATVWTFTNYMTSSYPTQFWLKSTYSLGSLLVATGLIWTLIMVDGKLNLIKFSTISFFSIFFMIGSFQNGFVASHYTGIYSGGSFSGTSGIGLTYYATYYIILSIIIIWKLFTFQKSLTGEEKLQVQCVLIGSLITLTVTAFSSFVLPVFNIFDLGGIDCIGFLFFLLSIAYAITKHHLFNLKVISIQLLIFALWTTLFIRLTLTTNLHDLLLEGSLFTVSVVFGILLIRNILLEKRHRQRVEELTHKLKQAYKDLEELDMIMPIDG